MKKIQPLTKCMRNGGFWFKVKVLSFKIRFCNGDSDAHLTPTTAHAQTLAVILKMKLIPYYKRTITSSLTNDSVLNKLESIIINHRTNNFPDYEDFIGGEIKNGEFKIFRRGKGTRKPFPVSATGRPDSNGNWTLTFAPGKWRLIWFLAIFSAMTFVTVKYESIFFVPLMILDYVIGQISFNNDSRILEKIISDELRTI